MRKGNKGRAHLSILRDKDKNQNGSLKESVSLLGMLSMEEK